MIKSLDISKVDYFVIIFIFTSRNSQVVHIFIGLGVGWVFAMCSGASHNAGRLMMSCIAFQGTTAIPIVFAAVLGNSNVTSSDKNFGVDAITYVLIYTVFVTVYKWTVAYGYELFRLLKPNVEKAESALMDSQEMIPEEIQIILNQGLFWKIKKSINPPIIAAIIAIPLALIPYSKEYVFTGSGSILYRNLFAALSTLGGCVSPMINLTLGANLSEGYPPTATIPW